MPPRNSAVGALHPIMKEALSGFIPAELLEPRAVHFDPAAMAYEAFRMGLTTHLLDPLEATTYSDALAETTSRWAWDRGDRLAIREIGNGHDRLFVHAVRRKATGVRHDFTRPIEHQRWLELICTVDLDVIGGTVRGLVGSERDLHARRQAERPQGARR